MKKIFLLMMVMAMSLHIGAQGHGYQKASKGTMKTVPFYNKSVKSPKSRFAAAVASASKSNKIYATEEFDTHRTLSLFTGEELPENGLGLTGYPGTYELMSIIPTSKYSKMEGGKITSIRFALAEPCNINGVFVYTVAKDGALRPLAREEMNKVSMNAGWNIVDFTEPCQLPDSKTYYGIAIGFSYVQTKNNFPISVKDGFINESFLLYGDLGGGKQVIDYSNEGILMVQAIVDCPFIPQYDVVLSDMILSKSSYEAGSDVDFALGIYNFGSREVKSYKIDLNVDGQKISTITENDYKITGTPTYYTGKFTLPANISNGRHSISAELMEVNGEKPTVGTEDDALAVEISTFLPSDQVERQKYLIEECTSHSCTYCPMGAAVLEAMTMKNPDKLAIACIHGNQSSKDPFNTNECQQLISYLGCTSFPSGTMNRIFDTVESSISLDLGYNQTQQKANFFMEFLQENSTASFATVDIETKLSDDNTKLAINVSGKGGESANALLNGYSLTVYVLEDSLVYRQLNQGTWVSDYVHNHVLRKVVTAINGDDINWLTSSQYSNSFEVALDQKWIVGQLSVVAFLSKRQPLTDPDYTDMLVNNANSVHVLGEGHKEDHGGDSLDDDRIDVGLQTTPFTTDCQLMGEGMSQNAKYMTGLNYATYCPAIWNAETGLVTNFTNYEEGALHAISNNGIAVGTTKGYGGKALVCKADGTFYEMSDNGGANSEGADVWAISADGSVMAGFYFYFQWLNQEMTDGEYIVYPAVWRNGVCTNLPYPTDEEMGYHVSGAEVRYMSADGKVLLGFINDDMSKWPAVIWRQNAQGEYVCEPICKDYFEMSYQNKKPYIYFSPSGISANGEWVALTVQNTYDDFDFSKPAPAIQAARLNLATNKLEVLDMGEESIATTGIANDGTMLIYTSAASMVGRVGYMWKAGETTITNLDEMMNKVKGMPELATNTPVSFSEDGSTVGGFAMDIDTNIFCYFINLKNVEEATAIKTPEAEMMSGDVRIYNLAGQRVIDMSTRGIYIVNGKKYLVK